MTFLSLYASRFIILWAVALVPLWAELVERLVPRDMFVWARGPGDHRVCRSSIVDRAVAAVLLIVINLHPTRFGSIFRPRDRRQWRSGCCATSCQSAARIYNDYGWAGPLILDGLSRVASRRRWSTLLFQGAGRMAGDRRYAHRPDLARRARTKASPRCVFPLIRARSGTHRSLAQLPSVAGLLQRTDLCRFCARSERERTRNPHFVSRRAILSRDASTRETSSPNCNLSHLLLATSMF